jgi:hypothetical protein
MHWSILMNQTIKGIVVASLMAAIAIGPKALAGERGADATITFSGGSIAAGIGYSWGNGVLHYKGQDYPFTVNGLSVVDVGVSHIEGAGEVYNLPDLNSFSGNYAAAGVGATLAAGGSIAALENQNGVIVHFHSTTQGLKLNLSANGISVSLKQ